MVQAFAAPNEATDFEMPDTSDLDRWVGVPIAPMEFAASVTEQDIRHWVQAMNYPNPLHYDAAVAAASRFGGLVAPQSFPRSRANFAGLQGRIPGSHASYAGNETWFYGARIFPGDRLVVDRMMFDYSVRKTSFAGPTVFTRGDATVITQEGKLVSKQRATMPRYLVANVKGDRGVQAPAEEPQWTDEQIDEIEQLKIDYIQQSLFKHEKRLFGTVQVGDELPRRVLGPHSIATLAFEAAVLRDSWGDTRVNLDMPVSLDMGHTAEMSVNAERAKINPAAGDEYLYGGGRGHLDPKYSGGIGIPRGFGMGASEEAWIVDHLASWAGEWGFVRHLKTQFRFPVLAGDVTYFAGKVTGMWVNPVSGKHTVQIACDATNQDGELVIKATGDVELPAS